MPAENLIIPSKQIIHFNYNKLRELIIYMYDNMINDGIGLAAPQIGVNLSCMVLNSLLNDDNLKDALVEFDGKKCYALFNVKIIDKQEVVALPNGEGCLSVFSKNKNNPFLGKVNRYKKIKIKYQDINGKSYTCDFAADMTKKLTGVVIQHELDHLSGILFPHRMKNQGLEAQVSMLLQNYMAMHNLFGSQKRIDHFMRYGIENINNDLHTISTIDKIEKLCKDRDLPDNMIKDIIQYIEYFDSK